MLMSQIVHNSFVCEQNMCNGCMACINVCPVDAIKIIDSVFAFNAAIDSNKCLHCKRCINICPNNNEVEAHSPIDWFQGWTTNDGIRAKSSSGGIASEIEFDFINKGNYVCSCTFSDGGFVFKTTDNTNDISLFAGSKYVKSNPIDCYKMISDLLKKGKKVLFVGLPCQCAGVLNSCRNHKNLYTIDLICHGTPSKKLLEKYLSEKQIDINYIHDISFRTKSSYGLKVDGFTIAPNNIKDGYTAAFVKGMFYTENCYSCKYAKLERITDLTLGDAWGQMANGNKNGVSLILCHTQKGQELINNSHLVLKEVNIEKAVESNHQLNHPTIEPSKRKMFIKILTNGGSFKKALLFSMPKEMLKNHLKRIKYKIKKK